MLGAAHVLAMDSKNLLDVVDAIRIRYPHINKQFQKLQDAPGAEIAEATTIDSEQVFPTPVACTFYPQTATMAASSSNNSQPAVDS